MIICWIPISLVLVLPTMIVSLTQLKKKLLPFIKRIQKEGTPIDDSILFTSYDIKKQEAFMQDLLDYMQVNRKECSLSLTEHPFTSFFSAHETRITTHYYEHNVMSEFSLLFMNMDMLCMVTGKRNYEEHHYLAVSVLQCMNHSHASGKSYWSKQSFLGSKLSKTSKLFP